MPGRWSVALSALILTASVASARDWQDRQVQMDSLRQMPPKYRAGWLRSHCLDDSYYTRYRVSDSSGLRLCGKWGMGPSLSVVGRDSIVFLALGSEVAIVNAANPAHPRVLSEVQLGFLPSRVRADDSLLLIGGNGIEVWNFAAPVSPQFVSRIPYAVSDFCVRDSFAFLVSLDSFMVYSIANPASPTRVGACPDSGYAVSVTGNTVVLMRFSGLGFVDVADPTHPQPVGDYSGYFWSATARGNVCCVTVGNPNEPDWLQLQVLDISDPSAVYRLGSLDSAGGYNLVIEDSLVFASGFYTGGHEFQVISIRDSTHPTAVGALLTPGDNWDVWVNRPAHTAYVADRTLGLAIIDISNPALPILDTEVLRADMAYDVSVQGGFAYVADYTAGLKVLDISDPTRPTAVGLLDTMSGGFTSTSVAAKDSFVFASWWPQPKFRAISVVDPATPEFAGGCNTFDQPQGIVVRDTLAYLAERLRLQVVNVARPREPVLLGSCVLPDWSNGLWLSDTVAYVGNLGLVIVSVANPTSPQVIGTWPGQALGVQVVDTVAFVSCVTSFVTLSVADPAAPRTLDSVAVNDFLFDVAVVETLAYAGGKQMHVFDIANPSDIREVGTWMPPYDIRRVIYAPPYLYAACVDAGVCVLETVAAGLTETPQGTVPPGCLGIAPNPASTSVLVRWGPTEPRSCRWWLYDAAGRVRQSGKGGNDGNDLEVDLTLLETGVYFLEVQLGSSFVSAKVVRR